MKVNIKSKPQIVALGGGGFSEEPNNPLLDDFIIRLTGKKVPRICFVPTASGDAQGYIDNFYAHFPAERADSSHLSLFQRSDVGNFKDFLLNQDVIYVGGGNTVNMLSIWRLHGIDNILIEAWKKGVILCGLSSGMICWFEESLTNSFGGLPTPLKDGLGLLKGSACPHYDREPERRIKYKEFVKTGQLSVGYAADNGAAIHFIGTEFFQALSSIPDARVYSVCLENGCVVERPIETRCLG